MDFLLDYWYVVLICLIGLVLFIVLIWYNINSFYKFVYEEKLRELRKTEQRYFKWLSESDKEKKSLDQAKRKIEQTERTLAQIESTLNEREANINAAVREKVADTVMDLTKRDYLSHTPVFSSLRNCPNSNRLVSALSENMRLSPPFNISSRIQSASGNVYETTLFSCSCKDFSLHNQPCKHMYRLAAEVGALLAYDSMPLQQEVSSLYLKAKESEEIIDKAKKEQQKATKARVAVEKIASETSQTYPWLAHLFADYFNLEDRKAEAELRNKKRPSLKAADELKRIRQENRELRAQTKAYEYQLHYYESIFPWLEEFKELSPKDAYQAQVEISGGQSTQDEYKLLRDWLSPDEYAKLSNQEKYQLALDRFQRRPNKTRWEIGIEYERYIGYLCEKRGFRVEYTGAQLGLEDMGRDLILSSGENSKIVIQCKRWGQEKHIHEKHIFQLFGSSVLLSTQFPNITVKSVFVTTTQLSETARRCADKLGVIVHEHVPIASYPIIKCNIGSSGEKIYHLPFDQQYDRIIIAPHHGEFYANTIEEAEAAGFRRAKRHNPVR